MNINTTGRSLQTLNGPQGVRVKPTTSGQVPANYAIHRLSQPISNPIQTPPQDQSKVNTTLKQAGGLENPGMVSFPNLSPEKLVKEASQNATHIRRVQRIPTVQNLSHNQPTALGATPATGGNARVSSRPVTAKAPTQKVSDAQAEKMGEHYKKKLNDRMKAADPKSDVGQYYRTTQLLQEYAYYKQTGKGPLADDPQARELVEANLKFLENKARDLAKSPEVKKAFAEVRTESIRATFGSQAPTVAKHYANYLRSDEFAAELKKMPPQQRKEALAKASLKLAALDPDLAKATVRDLAEQQLKAHLVENLNKKGPEGDKAREALRASLKQELMGTFGNTQEALDKVNKLVDQLMDAFQKNPALLLSKDGMSEALQETAKAFKNMKHLPANLQTEMQGAIKGLNRANGLGSVLSVAALVNGALILGNGPQSAEDVLKGLGGVTSGISGLGALGKVANLASDSALLGRLASLGALGPIGDALGVAADVAGFMREGANEDEVGRFLKGASVVTGTAATFAGAAVLLGCSSPLAPVVLAGAAAAGLAITAADYFYAESDKTGEVRKILRDTGLSTKQDVIKAQFDKAAGFTDDYALMLKQFQNLPNAESRVRYINQILDNKDVWINASRVDMVKSMLQGLSAQDLEELVKNGLHLEMMGRKIGFNAGAVTGIAQKLESINNPKALATFLQGVAKGGHAAVGAAFQALSPQSVNAVLKSGADLESWGQKMGADPKAARQVVDTLMATNTPESRKALAAFLTGLAKGGHHKTLESLLASEASGEKLMAQLTAKDVQELVMQTQDGKLAVKMLERSTWEQFNTIMGDAEASGLLNALKNRLVNTEDSGLLGKLAAWGEDPQASSATQKRLRSWFKDFQDNSNIAANYARAADAYVKELTDTQLQDLNPELKQRLSSTVKVAPGYYISSETRERLEAAGIIQ